MFDLSVSYKSYKRVNKFHIYIQQMLYLCTKFFIFFNFWSLLGSNKCDFKKEKEVFVDH